MNLARMGITRIVRFEKANHSMVFLKRTTVVTRVLPNATVQEESQVGFLRGPFCP